MTSELQRLSDEATAGAWTATVYDPNMYGGPQSDIHDAEGVTVAAGGYVEDGGAYCGACTPADAALIVALVNAYREGRLAEVVPVEGGDSHDQQ